MDTSDQLPFVVHLDDCDESGDVLDSLALGPLVAGRRPVAQTQQLSRVRPHANFIPAEASSYRLAEGPSRTVLLCEGSGWTLKATRWRDNTASLIVTATDKQLAEAILAEVSGDAREPPPPAGLNVPIDFWRLAARGSQSSSRSIEVTHWDSIRRNYTAALSRLLNLTDGLLGQGQRILVCITTNEDLSRFHPAAVRPGRCLKQIGIGPLNRQEAAAWLGVDPSSWSAPATVAELYAAQGGYRPSPIDRDPPVGHYL